jgi:hypothetical protein
MLTGYFGSNVQKLEPMFPSAGSITAKVCGANRPGLPAYVAVPFAANINLVPGYNGAAWLGQAYDPFQCGGDPNAAGFAVKDLTLPGGLSVPDLENRKTLLDKFDTLRRDIDRSGTLESLDKFQRQAYELISGPAARQAFDVGREDPRLRDRYGRHTWGQSVLLARRLVEAGVTFVTVHMGGWDHHGIRQGGAIKPAMESQLPILDCAIASLVEDLCDRGLYDKVALCVCGEFGREPRVNQEAGRDHWCQAGFTLLGGGGLKGGLAVGSTTARGEEPRERAVGPGDVLATLYHVLGIDTTRQFTDRSGRPHAILSRGRAITELV